MIDNSKAQHRRRTWLEVHGKPFDLEKHERLLLAILGAVEAAPELSEQDLGSILRRNTLPNGDLLSKDQLLKGYRQLCEREGQAPNPKIIRRLRVKPTRTISGVAPVAVMTKPYPCPGQCIFCPSPEGLPTSYLADEPGAMRGIDHGFDPFKQTASRIAALQGTGHSVDKIELLVLGGSWSAYPEAYQESFVRRCLDAMNKAESTSLEEAQRLNESALHRNVGLVVETRPDLITPEHVRRLRWLGVTKIQMGVQSLDDAILVRNCRGHNVDRSRQAVRLLRLAGFKIVLHWMPNLLGATPTSDHQDFMRLWDDPALRPDEVKLYPTALLADTGLYEYWQRGEYQPYDESTLIELLMYCKTRIPPYCRINRLMRDIPAQHIIAGVTKSNLRQIVQHRMEREGLSCHCIRCREIRGEPVDVEGLQLERIQYETDATREFFLQYVASTGELAAFLRLSLPQEEGLMEELRGSAVVREVHVYGPALDLDTSRNGAAQHAGLGTQLLDEAERLAAEAGYQQLAVIAAVGTRPYYRERGFELGRLYMSKDLQ
jgi:elongator complex protein 3